MPKTMILPCALPPEHHLSLALEMSAVIKQAEEKEAEKKRVSAEMTEEINSLWSRIHDLNGPVLSGKENRDVPVEERLFIAAGEVEIWRLDTDPPTLHVRRALNPDERQLKNGLENLPKDASAPPPEADEQRAATPEEAEKMREERLRGERLERARVAVGALVETCLVLPTSKADPADAFRAAVGPVKGFPWADIVEAFGSTEEEARAALVEKCAGLVADAVAGAVSARHERIMAKFGELFATHTITKDETTGRVVAKIEGDTWVMESDGADETEALAQLRVKLLASIESKEAEIEALTAEQAKDAEKTPTLLKAPKRGKTNGANVANGKEKPPKVAKNGKAKGVEMTVKVGGIDYAITMRAETAGGYTATCAAVPGATGHGLNIDEACQKLSEAIASATKRDDGDQTGLVF